MKAFFKYIAVVAIVSVAIAHDAMSQAADISPERKQAIDSLALEKVRDLSKYITRLASEN